MLLNRLPRFSKNQSSKKSDYRFYFSLAILFFFLMSLSPSFTKRLKGVAVKLTAPAWEKLASWNFVSGPHRLQEEIAKLQLENHLLEEKIAEMETLLNNLSTGKTEAGHEIVPSPLGIQSLCHGRICSVPAKVIYRSPALWENVLWVNVGEANNEKMGYRAIAKNSPVVLGSSLIGVVEEVEEHQSMIRLITDNRLTPSVRVLREEGGDRLFLAKGEIRGSGHPLWRSKGHLLKGVGFNCDFSDNESPKKDLRSADPLIIKLGDLLVTTGLDGVFPMGLRVGSVTWVETLKEGDYFYSIEAEPDAKNLDSLSFVYILPPVRTSLK